jgi:hypothetical protein
VGLGSTGVVAGLLYFSIAFGKVTVTSLNAYGSFMSMATIWRFSARSSNLRMAPVFYIVSMVGVSALLALTASLLSQSVRAFILCLLAVFTPWSAINLIDYYCPPVALRCRHCPIPMAAMAVEWHRHHHLPDRNPGSDPVSFHGVLHGPTGRAARRCGYLG